MCGRFALYAAPDEVRTILGYHEAEVFPPRYNIAPTQPIAMVHAARGKRSFALVRWGLVPRWVDDPRRFELLINARAESVHERPAFRDAIRYRRCLIPASGYYAWRGGGAERRPFFIRPQDGRVIAFAGLFETWSDRQHGGEFDSGCIITTDAGAWRADIGARMPVTVAPRDFDLWLWGNPREASTLLQPVATDAVEVIPVGARVNWAENDDPELIAPDRGGEVPFS